MNTRMMFARVVAGAAMLGLAGCWSPLVVGEPMMWESVYFKSGLDISPVMA